MIYMKKDGEWLVGHLVEDVASVGALLREQWRLPRKQVHLLFQHKEVLLDGTPAAQLAEAKAGQEIRLRLCRPEPLGLAPVDEPADILYEDDHLLVANKPPGLLLHPTEPRHTRTLDHLIAGHFARTGVAAKVRHVHRLDQDTSGVVLYAKHALASALLDERLRERNISRSCTEWSSRTAAPSANRSARTAIIPIGAGCHPMAIRRLRTTAWWSGMRKRPSWSAGWRRAAPIRFASISAIWAIL